MRDIKWDQLKELSQLKKEHGKTCSVPGCDNPLTHLRGPGSGVLCREHQVQQKEYGGLGRYDRPHTFHRRWNCEECNFNVLEDPRLADVKDEMTKRRIASILMHGDHNGIRRADGGDDSAKNIRSLCYVCHAKKTVLNKDYRRS